MELRMRAFPVDLPSGTPYWTVLDDEFRVVPVADQWLRLLRFGRSRAELTTRSYAAGAAFYFRWCQATGREWAEAARDMGLFMVWLRYTPSRIALASPATRARPQFPDPRDGRPSTL
jgi:integrase/recombinase XerD